MKITIKTEKLTPREWHEKVANTLFFFEWERSPHFRQGIKKQQKVVWEPRKQRFIIGLAWDPKTLQNPSKILPKCSQNRPEELPKTSPELPKSPPRAPQSDPEAPEAPNMVPKAPKGCPRCPWGDFWDPFWLHFELKMEVSEPILTQIGPQLRTPDV